MRKTTSLLPGSKGWVKKYLDLVQKGRIRVYADKPSTVQQDAYIHAVLGKTGISFGYPSSMLFIQDVNEEKWTTEEKLKLLLFEAHLFVFQLHYPNESIEKEVFTSKLLAFYGNYHVRSITKLFTFFLKESQDEKLESILTDRVDIRLKLLENKLWINYVHNVFIYLDVILFHEYLSHKKNTPFYQYDEHALNALNAIAMASSSDGVIEDKEHALFNVFLASANISDTHRTLAERRFKEGGGFQYFNKQIEKSKLVKRFLIDLAVLVIYSNHEAVQKEREFLSELTIFLGYSENELQEALALTEQFVITNHRIVPFLSDTSSLEKLYSSLSKRWIKILGRNKDKFINELKQSKELVTLIRKSTKTELTKEEKEQVKEQFKDIVRSMPSLAIFMLPGGAFLLPLVLKVIPDLIPSAFRDNTLDE